MGRVLLLVLFFFSSRRRHTRFDCDWSSDVCSSDLSLFNGARVVGPALGGLLVAFVGVQVCFVLNAASFVAVLAGLLLMRADDLFRLRSEERRVGKECRSRWSPYH